MPSRVRVPELALALVLLVALSAPALAGSFSMKCGSAKIPKTGRSGAVCVGFCGSTPLVSCAPAVTDDPSSATPGPGLASAASHVRIRLTGKAVTLGHLADRLRVVTGWKVVVPRGFEAVRLKAGEWKGTWAQLQGMRWKLARAGRAVLSVDTEGRSFSFALNV